MPRHPALEALSEQLPARSDGVAPFELTRIGKSDPEATLEENPFEQYDDLEFSEDELTPFFDEDDEEKFEERGHRLARGAPAGRRTVAQLYAVNDEDFRDDPNTTFTHPGMEELHSRGLVRAVLWPLKSGKEATVYVCEGNEGLVAAKIYVDSRARSFQNDALYREGRFVSDGRMKKAIDNRTAYGISAQNYLWVQEEFIQLNGLYDAGVRVPKPLAHPDVGGVILMEFIGNEDGPAPRVADARLTKPEAEDAFAQALEQYALILASGRVHGDYSTFNLLWWGGKCIVIDFPQVVYVKQNPAATTILERDLRGLCKTFSTFGIKKDWQAALQTVRARARALQTTKLTEEMENIL
jgi:RIO kinase 1